jgi:hypothetical protein
MLANCGLEQANFLKMEHRPLGQAGVRTFDIELLSQDAGLGICWPLGSDLACRPCIPAGSVRCRIDTPA